MEFFRELPCAINAAVLQESLSIEALPRFCGQIETAASAGADHGEIYCLWGTFDVSRERINGGLRFSLPKCPNALAWTITTGLPPHPYQAVIHCTINRRDHDPDFVESIELFLDDWAEGLGRLFESQVSRRGTDPAGPGIETAAE